MRKSVLIILALATIGIVCALKYDIQRADVRLMFNTAATIAKPSVVPASTQHFGTLNQTTNSGEVEAAKTPLAATNPEGKNDVSKPEDITSAPASLAEKGAVEATIIEVVEDGQITFQSHDPVDEVDRRALLLQDIVKNRPDTASQELLSLFKSQNDADGKTAILSAASLVPYDQNTGLLLQYALSPNQPDDLRVQAAAFAAREYPELMLNHLDDPNPLVIMEFQNAFISSETFLPVVGARTPSHPELTGPTRSN